MNRVEPPRYRRWAGLIPGDAMAARQPSLRNATPEDSRRGPRPRIVHLTSVHPAHDTRIFHRECVTLAAAGFDVVLVAPHEGEAIGDGGVRIRSVPVPRGRLERMCRTVPRILATAFAEKGDVYHYHDPELIPGALLLKLMRKTVVADLHENVPGDIRTKFWVPRALRKPLAWLVGRLQGLAAHTADAVVAATPAIADQFPSGTTLIVRNYPIRDEWASIPVAAYDHRPFTAAYVGKIERVRGIREMLEAIHLVHGFPGTRLALVGDFAPDALETEMQSVPGWERVDSTGFLTRPEVGRILGSSRVGLVLLHPGPNHEEAQPNKLFEYLAAGLPVVVSDFPLWRELVEGIGCGLAVNPLDPAAIAGAITALFRDPERARSMGQKGRDAVSDRFNWDRESGSFLEMYETLTGWRPGGTRR